MNNAITVNETDVKIHAFLKDIGVSFKAVSIGIRKDKDWQGDDFKITLTRKSNGKELSTCHASGFGHRIVRSTGLTQKDRSEMYRIELQPVQIDKSDWSNDDRKAVNKLSAPGLARVFAISPTSASVLYGLQSDVLLGSDSHADFCANLGYDEDSRKGLEIYLACQKIGNEFNAFFTHDEREKLNELLEDY